MSEKEFQTECIPGIIDRLDGMLLAVSSEFEKRSDFADALNPRTKHVQIEEIVAETGGRQEDDTLNSILVIVDTHPRKSPYRFWKRPEMQTTEV